MSLYSKDICLPAMEKVEDYIRRREIKDARLEKVADSLQTFTLNQFFDHETAKK